jgi:hypothetical protein
VIADAILVSVSHRARWDLELLPPGAATACFELLDDLIGAAESEPAGTSVADLETQSLPLVAGFDGLRVVSIDGFRLVFRVRDRVLEVIHVDASDVAQRGSG